MKTDEEIMEILAAYDLTGSYRRAAQLAGCDHHTVRRYVRLRSSGTDPTQPAARVRVIDGFMPKRLSFPAVAHGGRCSSSAGLPQPYPRTRG